jgi:hypothetical protein
MLKKGLHEARFEDFLGNPVVLSKLEKAQGTGAIAHV